MTTKTRHTQELATFLGLTFALSSIFYVILIRAHTLSLGGGMYVFLLMWSPGTAALITRLIFQRNVRGEGWKLGPARYELAGYALPIAYATCAYGLVWLLHFGGVDLSRAKYSALTFLVLGLLQSLLSATGEELGWRGFLVPKLAERYSFTTTALVSGVIWASWHTPLIIGADYNGGTPTWYSILCFMVMVIGISFPLAWLRLRSGSVWPCALLHASHNLFIQGFFDRVTVDTGITKYLLSEFGAVLALTAAITGVLFWMRRPPVEAADAIPATSSSAPAGYAAT